MLTTSFELDQQPTCTQRTWEMDGFFSPLEPPRTWSNWFSGIDLHTDRERLRWQVAYFAERRLLELLAHLLRR